MSTDYESVIEAAEAACKRVHADADQAADHAAAIGMKIGASRVRAAVIRHESYATESKSVPPDPVGWGEVFDDGSVEYYDTREQAEAAVKRPLGSLAGPRHVAPLYLHPPVRAECRSVTLDTLREHLDHYTFAADHSLGASAERNSAVEEFLKDIIAEHTDCGSVDGKDGE